MKYKGILLDLDQTLVNTDNFWLGSKYQKKLSSTTVPDEMTAEYQVFQFLKDDLKIISWEDFKAEYLKARKDILKELHGSAASHNRYLFIQRALESIGASFNSTTVYKSYQIYWNHILENMKLFDGAEEFLKNTDRYGIPTILITDLTADIQNQKLMKLGISDYIDYLVTSEEAGADKPAINQLILSVKKTKIKPNELIIIGNSPNSDIALGNNYGVDTVLYDPYKLVESEKESATYYITHFNELNPIFGFDTHSFTEDKLIVFDLIGTLSKYNHLRTEVIAKFFNIPVDKLEEPYAEYQINKISSKEFWSRIGITDYLEAEKKLFDKLELKPEAVNLINSFRDKAKLAILSNVPKEWGEKIIKKYNLENHFDEIILSGEVQLRKSKPEMYQLLKGKFPQIAPENMYFIDNELEDLLTGKDFLINTIWYKLEEPDAKFIPDYIVNSFQELEKLLNMLI